MEIRKVYIGTKNGINGMWCDNVPQDVIITEVRDILHPQEGYLLEHITTHETFEVVWLKNGDVKENYIEVIDETEDATEEDYEEALGELGVVNDEEESA